MKAKRTETTVTYSRTIQVPQYCPISITLTTTLRDEEGVSVEDIKLEEKNLENFVDRILEAKVNTIQNS